MKKLLLVGTTLLLMATSASAQSTSPAAAYFGGGMSFGSTYSRPISPAVRAKIERNMARGKAEYECKAYGICGQQRRR